MKEKYPVLPGAEPFYFEGSRAWTGTFVENEKEDFAKWDMAPMQRLSAEK